MHWVLVAALPTLGLILLSLSSNDAKALRGRQAALEIPAPDADDIASEPADMPAVMKTGHT